MMYSKSFLAVAMLVAAATAAPAPAPVAEPAPAASTPNKASTIQMFTKRNEVNDCAESTFINDTSGGSPSIYDCKHIAWNIRNGGTWTTWDDGERQILQKDSCAFSVTRASDSGAWYNIGNQDVEDLINSASDMFGSPDGLVGAHGTMNCQGDASQGTFVTWKIYHT